jgi:hypothetical protein
MNKILKKILILIGTHVLILGIGIGGTLFYSRLKAAEANAKANERYEELQQESTITITNLKNGNEQLSRKMDQIHSLTVDLAEINSTDLSNITKLRAIFTKINVANSQIRRITEEVINEQN